MKLPLSFRVYPGRNARAVFGKRMFWQVWVHRDKGAMRRQFRGLLLSGHGYDGNDRFGAIVMPHKNMNWIGGEWVEGLALGRVLFARTQLGSETIAHESIHMATGYLRRLGKPYKRLTLGAECGDIEEDLAYAAGSCVRQIVNRLYREKIL